MGEDDCKGSHYVWLRCGCASDEFGRRYKSRHDILYKLFNLIKEHEDDLSRLITLENGKTLSDARVRDLMKHHCSQTDFVLSLGGKLVQCLIC